MGEFWCDAILYELQLCRRVDPLAAGRWFWGSDIEFDVHIVSFDRTVVPYPAVNLRDQKTAIVSKWAGHNDVAFTQRTYVHASTDDLEQGRKALARIHRSA